MSMGSMGTSSNSTIYEGFSGAFFPLQASTGPASGGGPHGGEEGGGGSGGETVEPVSTDGSTSTKDGGGKDKKPDAGYGGKK